MKHLLKLMIVGILVVTSFNSCRSELESARFLPSANLNLQLDAPVNNWDEALTLGNGILGGLLWGSHDTLRISLDRGDLWDLRIPERFSEADFNWGEMKKLVVAKDMKTLNREFDSFYSAFKYPTKLPGGRLEIILGKGQKIEKFELKEVF